MPSFEFWPCHIFLFYLFIICQNTILSTNTRIVFPNSEDEEDLLTKFQNKRNNSIGKQRPLENHQNSTPTFLITNGVSSMSSTLSPSYDNIIKIPIRKCCRRGQVLDKWHKCKNRDNVNRIFLSEVSSISNSSEASKFARNVFNCPRRLINEYVPSKILANGSVVIEMDDENITTVDYHCIELTEIELNYFDGLHVVMCSMEGIREDVGFIAKCCSKEEVLNEALDRCVDIPPNITMRNWIPPRTIISNQNLRPTGQYHLQHSLLPSICNGSGFMDVVPELFTTNGEVTIMVEDEFTMTEYGCADRVKIDDTEEVTDVTALICINEENVEVEKCCADRRVFSLAKQHCVPAKKKQDTWSPYSQFDIATEHVFHINTNFLSDYVDDVIEDCTEIYSLNAEESRTFLEKDVLDIARMKGRYCIDNMYSDDGSYETLVVICHEDLPTSRDGRNLDGLRSGFDDYLDEELKPDATTCDWTHLRNFFSFLSVISIICLLSTLLVYCVLPEFRSMHGKIVKCNVICTLMVNFFLLVVYNNSSMTSCVFWGYFGYFSNMAMFSWMTIMCFDLGWKFFKARAPQNSSKSKKFFKYCGFGFGFPVFFTVLAAMFQLSIKEESAFNPNIGLESCFIHEGGNRQLMFFFLPVFLLMIGNVSGFVFTLHLMNKAQASVRGASISRRQNSSKKEKTVIPADLQKNNYIDEETKEQMILYGKMFLALGLPWIFESIHHLAHGNHQHMQSSCSSKGEVFFRIVSIFGLCRGVFLFIIFACKKTIWIKMKKVQWLQIFHRNQSFLRTEKKRRQANGQFINEGFVKSGETNFSVLSTGSAINSIEMVQIERPSEKELKTMRFSKENIGKSLDNVIIKAKDSKIGKQILNKCLNSNSLDLHNYKNQTEEATVTLSSVTVHTEK